MHSNYGGRAARGQRAAQANFRRLWSAYEDNRDLLLMGAYREGSDPNIDEAVQRRAEQLAFIRQGISTAVSLGDSAAQLEQAFGGAA